ncbi:MAG: hypothetical protein ACEOLT_00070, partial [Candidatus Karelsulcia muelleri]
MKSVDLIYNVLKEIFIKPINYLIFCINKLFGTYKFSYKFEIGSYKKTQDIAKLLKLIFFFCFFILLFL